MPVSRDLEASSADWSTPRSEVAAAAKRRWPDSDWDSAAQAESVLAAGFIPVTVIPARFGVVCMGEFRGFAAVAKLDADPAAPAVEQASRDLAHAGAAPEMLFSDTAGATITKQVVPGYTARVERPKISLLAVTLGRIASCPLRAEAQRLSDFLRPRLAAGFDSDVSSSSEAPTATERKRALSILDELEDGTSATVHGDVSAGNVLFDGSQWLLIDPRGVAGDWHYDVAVVAHKLRVSPEELTVLCDVAGACQERVECWRAVAAAARV